MKRSRHIRLALLGTAGLMTLTACEDAGDDPLASGRFFPDAKACAAAYDGETCDRAYQTAQDEHARTAPKFADREACEAEFGAENCTPVPAATAEAGGSWFMPMMMGYMMGRMTGGAFAATPLYRDTQNTAYTGRKPVGRIDSARMPPPQRVAGTSGVPPFGVQRGIRDTPRGGFGRTGFGAAS